MPMSNEFVDALLDLFFANSAWSNVGDAAGLQPSAAAGQLWFALHSSDPGAAGNQSTNEVSYGGYARKSLSRASADFSRTGQVVSTGTALNFDAATSGSVTATHASIGSASSGAGHLWWSGPITPNIVISTGVVPVLALGSTFTLV